MKILLNPTFYRSILLSISHGRSQFHTKHASSKRIIIWNLFHPSKLNCRGFSDEKSPEDVDKLLNRPEVQEYLELIKREYNECENVGSISRPIVGILEKLKENENYVKDLSNLYNDKDQEICELIKSESQDREKEARELNYQLLLNSVPKEEFSDCRDVVIQIFPGAGGLEAKLFSSELFDMYLKYAAFMNWSVNYVKSLVSELGGISQAEASITGELAYYLLQNEAGVHRVQRVPETEKCGKVHTSTCKLNVLPDVAMSEVTLKESDLKFEFARSSGPGGQNVQKNESKVRITYIPTGQSVVCQEERTKNANINLAMLYLKRLIYEERKKELEGQLTSIKRNQATTIDRSDKIRTYNFPQNRITDHRLQYSSHSIQNFMLGTDLLHNMIMRLCEKNKETVILNEINRILKHGSIKEVLRA